MLVLKVWKIYFLCRTDLFFSDDDVSAVVLEKKDKENMNFK